MKIDRTNVDDLNVQIAIEIEPTDYKDKFDDEIKKLKNKVSLKGFRKGKTPDRVIVQMYGNSVLADVVSEKLQKSIYEYIDQEKIKILGAPVRATDNDYFDPDTKSLKSYKFNFELGLQPDFEVHGIDKDSTYMMPEIVITDDLIDKDYEALLKRNALRSDAKSFDGADDTLLSFESKEMEGDAVKKDGWQMAFDVLYKDIADESLKAALINATLNQKYIIEDIYKIENKGEDFIRKYILSLDDKDDRVINPKFELELKQIQEMKAPEVNEEFLEKVFGKEVKNEAEAREFIKKEIEKYYTTQSNNYLDNSIYENILEKTQFELPQDFLKKWLIQAENKTEDEVNTFFDAFINDMRMTLINDKLAAEFDVNVDINDVKEKFREQVKSYFGITNPGESDYLENIVNNLMSNQEQVQRAFNEVRMQKIFEKLKEQITVEDKKVSVDEFKEMVEKFNKTQAA
ncbi:MAG TPA: trigger factor [Saprospiraceae bacterium]|nr:hypothetical protein [Saprospiraceae bacterium]MCB9327178.1 hypothetical protein [Lewinellaceae bacterium]HPK10501.1 trigger factor [Saprospiraceae bacterium]HRX28344.1 trigger factor [Saprospiraceae bacterium]